MAFRKFVSRKIVSRSMTRRRFVTRKFGSPVAGVSYDTEAQAYFDAIVTNGGTISTATKGYINTFVLAAKADSYWTKMVVWAPFAGDQFAAAQVAFKPKAATTLVLTNTNFVSGDYTEATGLTGNGSSKFLNTQTTISSTNDTHMAVYNRSSSAGTGLNMGMDTGSSAFQFYSPYSDGKVYSDQYNGGSGRVNTSSAISTPYGFLVASRTASNAHAIYRNGSSVVSNTTSGGALPGYRMYFFAANLSDPGAGNYSSCTLSSISFGDGLTSTDVTNYSTALNALQTSLGRNTY